MKNFLTKAVVFFMLTMVGLAFMLLKYGYFVDYFYEKFTTPRQASLILGDSRSMQGIQPRVINRELKNEGYHLPMFNYSFTIAQINYGKPYTESIKKKLQPSKNGLFIVSVNPWLFTEREGDDLKNGIYSESSSPPNNMTFVNCNPNFEYFIRNFKYFHFRSVIKQTAELHKDGWLEESNLPKDQKTLESWKNNQVLLYKSFAEKWKKSEIRKNDFISMVEFLKKNGKVILVRMPVDPQLLRVEYAFWSNFDSEMDDLSKRMSVKYINFSKDNKYQTYDGNHIDKHGGIVFTKELCDSIKIVR
ncbi:hypothetical protein [Chryseobacterium koreense]|uniref:hypothetical protein n=1 Tax=Chryseobacterium koreense TaxID=232216 RepID=UPI0026EE5869|nr:hypothetical protein [Chryseobacterium koreense]